MLNKCCVLFLVYFVCFVHRILISELYFIYMYILNSAICHSRQCEKCDIEWKKGV